MDLHLPEYVSAVGQVIYEIDQMITWDKFCVGK